MKSVSRVFSYLFATLFVVLSTGFSVFAQNGATSNGSSLTAIQVIGGLALLLLVIFLPLIKGAAKKENLGGRSKIL